MRGTLSRLSRLESKRAPGSEARFYIFGTSEQDAAERYAAELRAGSIDRGDVVFTPIWPGPRPAPAPRWATPEALSDVEMQSALEWLAEQCGREALAADASEGDVLAEIGALRGIIREESSTI